MSVLYLALAIYIAGVAIVMYIRPSIMFHTDNGTWKEFGLDNTHRSTIFPFWMFTIVWAFLSYAIATVSNVFVANVVIRSSTPTESAFHMNEDDVATPISQLRYTAPASSGNAQVVHTAVAPTHIARAPKVPTQLPGYYLVEPQASGVPKFVYFGHEPPSFENLITHS